MKRSEILQTAEKYVMGDREQQYGTPEDNFKTIADFWNTYLGINFINSHDVPIMMCLLKVARIASGQMKDDNYIDLAGYAACAGEITDLKEKV